MLSESNDAVARALVLDARNKLRKERRLRKLALSIYLSLFVPVFYLTTVHTMAVVPILPLLVFSAIGVTVFTKRTRRLISENLTGLDDIRVIPPLLEAFRPND